MVRKGATSVKQTGAEAKQRISATAGIQIQVTLISPHIRISPTQQRSNACALQALKASPRRKGEFESSVFIASSAASSMIRTSSRCGRALVRDTDEVL